MGEQHRSIRGTRWALLWRSLAATRPTQLLRRAQRDLLRRWRARTLPAEPRPAGMAQWFEAPARLGLQEETARIRGPRGARELELLHHWTPLVPPVDWSAPGVPIGRPLAELAIHYFDYLPALDDDEVVALLRDWVANHRPHARAHWNTAWNSYGMSIRVVALTAELARRGAQWSDEERDFVAGEIVRQTRFLLRNLELDLGGNHLLKDLRALLVVARAFDLPEARGWHDRARGLLVRELDEQVLPDGCHFERSVAYQAEVFVDLLDCWRALDADDPLRAPLLARLRAMLQVVVDLAHPDGLPCLFNDGGHHHGPSLARCLAAWTHATGEPVPEPRRGFAFPAAGYFGLRHGDDLFAVDWGLLAPHHLPAHGHGDIGSFEWTVGGRRFVVDHGCFEYAAGEWRALARSTRMHNTVTLDDLDQAEFWSAFRVGRRPREVVARVQVDEGELSLDGTHDGYRHLAGAPRHRRRLVHRPGVLEVEDTIVGGVGQRAVARLLLHPEVQVEADAAGALRLSSGEVVLILEHHGPVAPRLVDALWCPDFGVSHRTLQIELECGAAPCAARWSLRRADPRGTAG